MCKLEVTAESVDDIADRLEVIAEKLREGYTGGPEWYVDENVGDK